MKHKSNLDGKPVYVVDGCRTPFLKARGLGPFSASDLAVAAGHALLKRQPFLASDLDEVIIGSVMASPDEMNIARVIALRLGCGNHVPAYTVARNCASGMQSIDNAALNIASGRSHLVLAGGTEAMSRAPLIMNAKMTAWFGQWVAAKSVQQRMKLLLQVRPSFLAPIIAILRGLTDPILGINMGQTAENVAYQFHLTREALDAYANRSNQLVSKSYEEGRMTEVIPIIDAKGHVHLQDDGYRDDSSLEALAKLKPCFDKKYGMVTAGNSSQITDGACLLLLASEEAVKTHQLPVLGRILDSQWGALSPALMGLGPVYASTPILQRHQLKPQDIDCWEINEAFAAQVLGCLAAWNDEKFCQTHLGLKQALGAPDIERINVDGGAIALGHPIGASGARIVLHLLHALEQRQSARGIATICIGGGQGGAMYLERLTGASTK